MTIHDVEEQLESALAAGDADRDYFIRQALQLLADDRLDAPQLHAIKDHVERALEAEGDDAIPWLREAIGMLVEYRHTGDVVSPELPDTGVDMVKQPVEVELPVRYASAVAVRLRHQADRGRTIDAMDVEDMARDYGVAVEEFTVGPDGQPLVEWLYEEAGLQVAGSADLKGDGEARPGSNTCVSDSER